MPVLGTPSDQQEVEDWQWMRIPHDDIDTSYIFKVEYSAENLEEHDQDQGKSYIFSVKAYNRAGLTTTVSTDPYIMHSQSPPTKGKIYHVSSDNMGKTAIDEIGFQEDSTTLCAKWTDFTHHGDEIQILIGVGSVPGLDDEVAAIDVENDGEHCFHQLSLSFLQTYYFIITAFNTKGSVNVTTKGIMVALENMALEYSNVNDGLGCSNDFTILDRNVELGNGQPNEREYIPVEKLSSKMRYTLAVQYDWSRQFADISVNTMDKELSHYSWTFEGGFVVEYFLVYLTASNQTISIALGSQAASLMIRSISINSCISDQAIQPSTKGLKSSWTFRLEIQPAITHYEMAIHEYTCTATGCQDGGQIMPMISVGSHTSIHLHQMILTKGSSYQTFVRPCFGPTCIGTVASGGILVDTNPASSSLVSCTIKPSNDFGSIDDIIGNTIYKISASWEAFQSSSYGMRNSVIEVYDWTLALTPSGGGLLMEWDRVHLPDNDVEINVSLIHITYWCL